MPDGTTLGDELVLHTEELVHRWYQAWRASPHPHPTLSEAAIKDMLPGQLRLIGEQLRKTRGAERPADMWKREDRLDPEARVEQEIPIEEIVQEYRIVVDTVRAWIEERGIAVSFYEYSYFHESIFQLTAESVRRYARDVQEQRARYLTRVMHQLRTPLSVVILQIDRVERSGADERSVAKLRRGAHRISALVDGLLRLEGFGPSEVPVRPRELDVAELVRAIMSDHEAEAARKSLRLEARVDPSLRVVADPELLVDALGNLVHNAVKHTSSGFVTVEAEARADDVVFRVRDSGSGIEPAALRALSVARPSGAGIGLPIALHAAAAQGGSIEAESEPGAGSTFLLRVPRRARAREVKP